MRMPTADTRDFEKKQNLDAYSKILKLGDYFFEWLLCVELDSVEQSISSASLTVEQQAETAD